MTMQRAVKPFILLCLVLFVAGGWYCHVREIYAASDTTRSASLRPVAPKEARELIERNKGNPNFVILDVRTPDEFRSGYIEEAVNIDYYGPGFQVELGKLDRTKTYLIYCRSGNRTEDTFEMMRQLGFREVYPLEGGIKAWLAAGYPVSGQKR